MKNFNKFLFLIIANIFIFGSAHSATFYVNGTTGNNANSPAQAKNISTPWLTVQYAVDNAAVVNGDNIVISEGTYAGFELSKRLYIIGAWKGSSAATNTIFNSTITLRAAAGSETERMFLKNLRVSAIAGDAIDIRGSYVTLENVGASTTGSGFNGIRLNTNILKDIDIEACNINNNNRAGIFFPSFADVDGFILKNSTISNNGYFGILAFQTNAAPTEIKNVEISHCAFVDNNPTNQVQGHTIYFEKLKDAVIENISVVMPATNTRIGIDINLLSRDDYTNISILNSRIIRSTPGSGIWIQARNDLINSPASLDTVLIRGLTFTNCDTNIAFNRQVKNMTVDKCDLSTYSVYGLVNFTDQGGTINASNNKWQGGGIPDTTIISGGLLVTGSPIISFMPSTNGIFVGMGIQGMGIPPGAIVIGKSPNTIIMSENATLDGFIPQIGFAFNFATSTDIVRTSLNFIMTGNPLPNAIVNQANVSFPDLASAIAGTLDGGTVWNVPSGPITGTTDLTHELKLISPGAGFLHSGSLTSFQNLNVPTFFYMGSDFAVDGNFTPGTTSVGTDNTLIISGSVTPGGHLVGGPNSDIFVGGSGSATALPSVTGSIRTLQLNRASGISLQDSIDIQRVLFLQNGLLSIGDKNLSLGKNATIFNPSPATSYINTNGTGRVKKYFEANTPTAFNYTVGAGAYSPVRVYFTNLNSPGPGANLAVQVKNVKDPHNDCTTDYLNRYWAFEESGLHTSTSNLLFQYAASDVVGTEANIYGARWDGFGWSVYTPVNPATHQFTTNNITGSYGEFTGGARDCLNTFLTQLNSKVFLEGAYRGSDSMRTALLENGIIPLTQPYGDSQFHYDGPEAVPSIPANVVDWIYLEIRETADGGAIPSGRRAAFLKSDGSIVDLDGLSPVKLNVITGDYFIVIGHRNHLPVMSTSAQPLSTSSVLYNFTTGLDKYYGSQAADLGGVFGIYSGDANKTFAVTASDYSVVTDNLLATDYNQADLNLTGAVTAADYSFITRNLLKVSNVPGYPPF